MSLTAPSPPVLLPYLITFLRGTPTFALNTAKILGATLLLLNIGSFPLIWHFRVFFCVFQARLALRWHKLQHIFSSRETKKRALQAWYEGRLQLGVHPFKKIFKYPKFVGFDDSDLYLHQSNSSYARALDTARFHLALATYPNLFRCGGFSPLAATHFHFLREIPMLTNYEVRCTLASWDEKWLYVICRFVKPPSKSKSASKEKHATEGVPQEKLIPNLTTPATPLTGIVTPSNNSTAGQGAEPSAVAQALLARAAQQAEPDGGLILAAISVSQLCFKVGRITVPPAIVLAANGWYASEDTTATQPPYWDQVSKLTAPDKMRELGAFYRGGWKEVPEAERWWEEAFKNCNEERVARLKPFSVGGLSGGLAGVRNLV
ncbi:Peptidase A1 domain-containing protein [Mycena kentingensis (nom. inval.)]|nr:Peptidase A1 domain-containing protein [Mycena kentingensis (nom. inval.)]